MTLFTKSISLIPSLSSPQRIAFSVSKIDYVGNELFFRGIFPDGLEAFHYLLEVDAAGQDKSSG